MPIPTSDRNSILQAIESWPLGEQVLLAETILSRAKAFIGPPQRPSWRDMAGIASTGQTPPSDEEVARWLDDHRSEKYGK